MLSRVTLFAISAAILSFSSANAQNVKLVCDGHGMEGGLPGRALIEMAPRVAGLLLEINDASVLISGQIQLRGEYMINRDASDDASYAFFNKTTKTAGFLNRYSGEIEMAICADEDCDEIDYHFKGTCSKQQRLF